MDGKDKIDRILKKNYRTIGPAETERLYAFLADMGEIIRNGGTMKIMDAGCGSGLMSFSSLLLNPESRVFMIDLDDRYKRFMPLFFSEKEPDERIRFERGDIFALGKPELSGEKFDIILCVDVIEHTVYYMDLISSLWTNCLGPQGYLYIQTPSNYPSPNFPLKMMLKKNLKQRLNRIAPDLVKFDGSSHVRHGFSCKQLYDELKLPGSRCLFSKEEYIGNTFYPECTFKPRTSILLKKVEE